MRTITIILLTALCFVSYTNAAVKNTDRQAVLATVLFGDSTQVECFTSGSGNSDTFKPGRGASINVNMEDCLTDVDKLTAAAHEWMKATGGTPEWMIFRVIKGDKKDVNANGFQPLPDNLQAPGWTIGFQRQP